MELFTSATAGIAVQQISTADHSGEGVRTSRDFPILFEMGRVRDASCRGEQEHVVAGARLAGLEAEVRECVSLANRETCEPYTTSHAWFVSRLICIEAVMRRA